ncbi:MAG: tripartite tricarboxylate transporter substrate binding protein [Betaproteobacteria bacterium]|nr:MAG: tripartite tricarboxylate transporter substrate binding protein [Betaproteobacteria bacterium]
MRWVSAFALCLFAGAVAAQSDYPSRPVRIIVPSPPAGGTDIVARVLASHFTNALGQQFYVENKPGAGNMIGIEAAARAAPDGYTLLMVASTLVLNSVLYKQVPYDPVRDFAPITLAATAPNILVVDPKLPINSLTDLIAAAKAKPGALSYGTPGIGTSPHLCMELLKSMAGIDLTHVPYRGTAAAVTDVMGGQIAVAFATALTAKPLVDAGRLRALAVSGPQRVQALPDVPPVAQAGVPGYEAMQWYGLLAPAGTAAPTIERLHREAIVALRSREMKERLATDGAEPLGTTPAQFAAFIGRERDKWTRVRDAARIERQ